MSERYEEVVRLPEALRGHHGIGSMVVRYEGYFQGDSSDGEGSRLLLDVAWQGRRYDAPMLLPAEATEVDPALTSACGSFLGEHQLHEADEGWRAGYLHKIDGLVEKAAHRLYKRLVKERVIPAALRPKKRIRK